MIGILRENSCFILILVFSSIALVLAAKENPPPRSVNIALETSFLFDPKDLRDNESLVKNLKGFLDKLYKILEPQKKAHFRSQTETHTEAQTKTQTKATTTTQSEAQTKPQLRAQTNTEEDDKNETFDGFVGMIKALGENIGVSQGNGILDSDNTSSGGNGATKQSKSGTAHEGQVSPDETINNLISNTMINMIYNNPEEIDLAINATLANYKHNPILKVFSRRMNDYYDDEDVKKLNRILKKFKRYVENNKDTTKVVKELLHNVIFQKFHSFNATTKANLMSDLKMLTTFLTSYNNFKGFNQNPSETRRNSPNQEQGKTIEFHNNYDVTYKGQIRSIDEKTTRDKNEDKKGAPNEIIVDNLELFLRPPEST